MSKNPNLPTAMDSQRKMLIALALSATCIFLIGAAGLCEINGKISDEQKVVANKQAQVGSNEQIAKRYQTTLDSYNQTLQKLRYLEPKMPHDAYVATLIQQLQKTSDVEGVKLTSVRPSDETDPNAVTNTAPGAVAGATPKKVAAPAYTQLLCAITVNGTYPQLMHFVYDLPRFPKILSVQGMTLHPVNQNAVTNKAPQLSADIGLVAYIFDDSTPSPAVTAVTKTGLIHNVTYNSNPVAFAAGRATSVAKSDAAAADVGARSGGLLDASQGTHSIQGGLGSEQQVPIR